MKRWAWRGFGPARWLVLLALLLSGCLQPKRKDDWLLSPPPPSLNPAQFYLLACPDAVDVIFVEHPDLGRRVRVNSEGNIDLGVLGKIRVEGETPAEARANVNFQRAGVSAQEVHVHVAEYNSRKVFLFGQVKGQARAVPYLGPETIVEFLRRTCALTKDSAWNEIHLVRAHLVEGMPPEVIPIDLEAILEHCDERTNIRLQPLDEIYVGEKVSSYVRRHVPTFLMPVYETMLGLVPDRHPERQAELAHP
jgi:polysaccharide export outer membrane protein